MILSCMSAMRLRVLSMDCSVSSIDPSVLVHRLEPLFESVVDLVEFPVDRAERVGSGHEKGVLFACPWGFSLAGSSTLRLVPRAWHR